MESEETRKSVEQGNVLSISRIVTLLGSILVALSSGTNYIYSAYAPQLGARLRISHTQLNIIGLAGNMGGYSSGPVWGRIVDRKGPRISLICACIALFVGYLGIKRMYDDGIGDGVAVSPLHFALLVVCSFMTGSGSSAGITAGINSTAKSFPSTSRATTTALVLSGFGLSAFWFSLLAHTLSPGDISAFLLILALGTAIPMVVGLFIVKPIPLPPTSADDSYPDVTGYNPIRSEDADLFTEEPQMSLELEVEVDGDGETDSTSAPLLSHDQEESLYQAPVAGLNPSNSYYESSAVSDEDGLPDVHGTRLWSTPDFYLIFLITGICSGTGVMYINNVGSIAQALYAKAHPVYDDIEASKWQVAQVSILSLGNFLGRILIGLMSDITHTRLRLPRAYCLCIVSCFFIISQAVAIIVSSVETLWMATLLLGLAYGFLFGCLPAIMIEWFGLTHFSENMGFVSLSPALGGNLFALMFGLYLDKHASRQDPQSTLASRVSSLISLASRGLPSEHQCFDGKECYLESLRVTLVACIVSLGLSWWAGIRDGQKVRTSKSYSMRTMKSF